MFRKMRRQDRQLSQEEGKKILENEKYGVLSLVGDEGYPYGIPMHYAMIGDKIYLHGSKEEGLKGQCIAQNPKVCFTVVQTLEGMKSQSVVLFGTIKSVPDMREATLEKLIEKFVPASAWSQTKFSIPFAIDNITAYEITVDHMSAKIVDKPN